MANSRIFGSFAFYMSANLQLLIGRMTQSEKIYFRKFAALQIGKETGTYSIKLFNYIHKHKKCSDDDCRAHFKGTYIEKFLPQVKAYLMQQLLRSLVNFHSTGLPANQYYSQYAELEILIEKGMHDYALKKILKCKKRSDWQRNVRFTLEIIRWQKTIMALKGFVGFTVDEVEALKTLENQMLHELEGETKLAYPYFETFSIIKNPAGFSTDEIQQKLKKAKDIASEIQFDSIKGYNLKAYYLNIFANYHYVMGEWSNELIYRKAFFELITHEYKLFTNNHQAGYQNHFVTALNNLIICSLKCGLEKESTQYLAQLEESISGLPAEYATLLTRPYLFKMKIAIQKGEYESAVKMGETLISKYPDPQTDTDGAGYLLIYFYMAMSYYMLDSKSKAMALLNRILNSPAKERDEVKSFARIFRLFSHIFTQDYEFAISEIRSIQRTDEYLKGTGIAGKKILELAKKLSKNKFLNQQSEILSCYDQEFTQMKNDEKMSAILEKFDILLILKKNHRTKI